MHSAPAHALKAALVLAMHATGMSYLRARIAVELLLQLQYCTLCCCLGFSCICLSLPLQLLQLLLQITLLLLSLPQLLLAGIELSLQQLLICLGVVQLLLQLTLQA
jgi:hypothetical protein